MDAEDPIIVGAVARLEAEDVGAARDAAAALGALTWGEGVSAITQEGVQHFLWYELPMKWLTDTDHHRRIAAALARAFDLLDLPRYADLCRSDTTAAVLDAYERSDGEGRTAFHRADVASGIRPPDIDGLEWGSVMGIQEAAVRSSMADMLELGVASGELAPGSRGWKVRQQELARAHLDLPRADLAGRTPLEAITDERVQAWLEGRRSPTRRRILEPLVEAVRAPAGRFDGAGDPAPRLRWLLGELVDGQPLTQTGNLNRAFVRSAAGRLGWSLRTSPRTEDELQDLHQLRHLAQRLGLARRSGRRLVLTPQGRAALGDTDRLWRTLARGLLSDHEFAAALGEVTLALLCTRGTMAVSEIDGVLAEVVHEVGWRSTATGAPPDDRDIGWARHQTTNVLRALDLLSTGGDWRDRTNGLTPAGRTIALGCLHHRATGPRSSPWG